MLPIDVEVHSKPPKLCKYMVSPGRNLGTDRTFFLWSGKLLPLIHTGRSTYALHNQKLKSQTQLESGTLQLPSRFCTNQPPRAWFSKANCLGKQLVVRKPPFQWHSCVWFEELFVKTCHAKMCRLISLLNEILTFFVNARSISINSSLSKSFLIR